MKGNREQIAWLVLVTSFVLCVGLAVGAPLSIRYFLRNASTGQDAVLEPQRGTPRMQRGGRGEVIALIGPTWDVPGGTVVTTDGSSEVLLTLYAPGPEPDTVATVQLYGDTEVVLVSARSPRFSLSPLPHRVVLEVRSGRARIGVSGAGGRDTLVRLCTPHLVAMLNEGSYEVRVRPALSELAVRDGTAQVTAESGGSVTLGGSERTLAGLGSSPLGSLPAERNLLQNGSFQQPVQEGWEVYHLEQQPPPGSVQTTALAGRPAAWFSRAGIGHAEVGIRQHIDYDVRDFTSLVLHLSLHIRGQSLPGCGSVGSECPIIVRIDYEDIYGTDRIWYHGFFALDAAASDLLYPWDEQVPLQTWVSFDSGNLIESFEQPPALIRTVTIYASGHSFDALVTEVELLAQE